MVRKVAGYRARVSRAPHNPPHPAAPGDRDTPLSAESDTAAQDHPVVDSNPARPCSRASAPLRARPPSLSGEAPSSSEVPSIGCSAILFTAEQAGSLLAVPGSWLRKKAAAREIPCRYLGKYLRFALADLTTIAEMAAQPADRRDTTLGGGDPVPLPSVSPRS